VAVGVPSSAGEIDDGSSAAGVHRLSVAWPTAFPVPVEVDAASDYSVFVCWGGQAAVARQPPAGPLRLLASEVKLHDG
jgi:hypothetical protein